MYYQRTPRPDPFEVMLYARRRVFVRLSDEEYQIISALRYNISVIRWCKGDKDPVSILYVDRTAESLGLFDGQAWDIPALASWLGRHCVICFQPLQGRQTRYHSNACKQRAYRERNK